MTRQATRVAHVLSAAAEAVHAHKATLLQVRIVAAVAIAGRTTPFAISQALRVSPSVVSKPCDDMVRAGFLSRAIDLEDRRKQVITATTSGMELIAQIDDAFRKAQRINPRKAA